MSVFDLLAHVYDNVEKREAPFLREVREDDVLLDLGGGTGRVTHGLRCRTIVCDRSAAMLEKARRKGMLGVLADASHLPFKKAFTKVVLVDSLHHFRNQETALEEAGRVMAKGGVLFIDDLDPAYVLTKVIRAVEFLVLERSRFLSPAALKSKLESLHFGSFSLTRDGLSFLLRAERQ